jgi:hypothetical protein
MPDSEIVPAHVATTARIARHTIEKRISDHGADSEAFWHAVRLSYQRGTPDVERRYALTLKAS